MRSIRWRNCIALGAVAASAIVAFGKIDGFKIKVHKPAPISSAAKYPIDYQESATFGRSSTTLMVTTKAVPQSLYPGGFTAYLLNGMTNTGAWAQTGLAYFNSYDGYTGYALVVQAFALDRHARQQIWPPPLDGSGFGWAPLKAREGDKIKEYMSINDGHILVVSEDLRTGGRYGFQGSMKGIVDFVGLDAPSTSAGFFSGVMTEIRLAKNSYAMISRVAYRLTSGESPSYLWTASGNAVTEVKFGENVVSVSRHPNVASHFSTLSVSYAGDVVSTSTSHRIIARVIGNSPPQLTSLIRGDKGISADLGQ